MNRLTAIISSLMLVISLQGWSADPADKSLEELQKVLVKLPEHRVEADYSFKIMQNDVAVLCSGHAVMQAGYFFISGNGLEIYCNSETIHYLDSSAKEAYIESAVKLEEYIKKNVGAIRDLKIEKITTSPISDNLSIFEVPELDGEWVVTDLR